MPTHCLIQSVSAARRTFARRLIVCVLASVIWGPASFTSAPARAESRAEDFVVIVNAQNTVSSAEHEFLSDAFLKKASRWPGGEAIHPVDLRPDSAVRRAFSASVLRRPVSAVRSYWQQCIFSGRNVPPPELDTSDDVIRYVATHRGGVGYVSQAARLSDANIHVLRVE
jgi:hypothetical protein